MSSSSRFLMEKTWERIQQKTFTKWINSHMSKKGLEVTDVQEDFENGIKLVQFLEIIGEDEIKYNKNPRIRIQKIENVNRALEYLKSKNVHLVAISSENIVDKDLKLILGMIWTIIQKFAIADISEEELSARDALLLWCKKKTAGYKDVSVKNFHYSWQDGLAFCALIHKHRPDLIDFDSLDKENKTENLNLAFDVAEKEFGIYKLLDAEDMVDIKPDERSVITYVAQYYHVFASSQKAEVAGRRIGNLIDMNKQHEDMKKDYTTSASALIDWINATTPKMEEREFDNSLAGARAKVSEFDTYRNTEKPPKVADKAELENKFNRIQIALRNAGRPVYVPADGQAPADVNQLWDGLQSAEDARSVALQEEVERQEKIEKLTRLFNLRTKKMEDWLTAKEAYLSTVEEVHSLNEAETKLKFLDAFGEEYAASKSNLDEINTLASSIKALTAANADDVQARAQAVDGRWNALQGQADGKRADLDEKLARQRKMEELRKEFASQATAYQSHVKKASNNAKDRNFGQSLESVQAYRSELESTANEAKADSENKKASLDSLWSEMEAIGIKENRYTPLTNTDIASSNAALAAAFDKRAQAYEEELKRQELLEAKRKEFAEKAQQFVDSVDGRRDSINALEGEPQPLIAAINDSYQNGAPEDQSLAAISALATEMAKLGISDNKHTKHTVPGLNVVKNKFGADVRNKVIALQEEDEAKQSYARRAAALQEWAAAKTPAVGSIGTFDNTQAGAEAAYAEWTAYKTGEKAERENEVAAVAGLADKIAKLLADNNRPAFSPASEEIDAAFAALKEAEAAREAELNEELARQEKLTALVKRFNSEAADHETWSENKQVYLNKEEQIASLTAANVQAAFLDEYNKDYTKRRAALDSSTLPVASEIEGLNYHDAATVRGRADALVANFDGLTELASAKGQAIAAAREAEENKERLRVEFAKSAKAFSTYTRVTVEAVSNTNFGSSLEDVEAAQADIASSDADINNTADAKKTEADGLSQELAAAGVSENPHTTLTDSDVTAFRQQIADAINKRSADYGNELSKQQEHESKRKAWAADAEAFAEWVGAQRSALDAISGDNKIADAQALHGGGAEGKSKIGGLQAGTAEMEGLGIYENKHTKYTQPILENLNAQYDDAVAAFVSTAEEESALATRQEQLQKDHDEQTRKENLRVEFETSKQKLALWLGNALDVVEDPIDCESVDDVNELQAAYDKVVASVPQAEHDNAHKLLGELQEAGVTGADLGNVHEQWEQFQSSSASRKSALEEELAKQQANAELCQAFATKADAFDAWIQAKNGEVAAEDSGSLEEQIAAAGASRAAIESEGNENLGGVREAEAAQKAAGVQRNPNTKHNVATLQTAFESLTDAAARKESDLQKEQLRQKESSCTPEQLKEFKEVFEHFDKDKTGNLSRLEFKSSLASLGEDPTDADMDRLMSELGDANGVIPFDTFVDYMVKRSQDSDSQDQILEAFKTVANDKDFITEDDMRRVMPADKVDHLVASMPAYEGVEGGFDYKAWTSGAFN
eukprot:TRINITY_DN3785_c0_g1_i1.p1 TRINITY_DN3785_c0_g1~~TRINITY_DN3785_c0_g1_i1.p1  ORF type:complete len:1558 (-),score=732.09 TRINITY_DN3785_c0_g1_i1:173-4762(-)